MINICCVHLTKTTKKNKIAHRLIFQIPIICKCKTQAIICSHLLADVLLPDQKELSLNLITSSILFLCCYGCDIELLTKYCSSSNHNQSAHQLYRQITLPQLRILAIMMTFETQINQTSLSFILNLTKYRFTASRSMVMHIFYTNIKTR